MRMAVYLELESGGEGPDEETPLMGLVGVIGDATAGGAVGDAAGGATEDIDWLGAVGVWAAVAVDRSPMIVGGS